MQQPEFDILFFAAFPTAGVNEGMAQRVLQIDEKFISQKRVYIDCSLKRFSSPTMLRLSPNLLTVTLNPMLHYRMLLSLIKRSGLIYFHSIYNYLHVAFLDLGRHKLILDVHGVVPEENTMEGRVLMSRLYSFLEKRLFKRLSYAICVSDRMRLFFQEKYPFFSKKIRFLTLPIVQKKADAQLKTAVKEIREDDIVFIYSGGLQKWQNVPLMLEKVSNLTCKSYLFLFLTQKPDELKGMIRNYSMNGHRIIVRSAIKEELPYYYSLSHYGFLLRDDHVVNAVASPTKMFEYLEGGITPILLSENIGDLKQLGIDKINIADLNDNLTKRKSVKNQQRVELLREKASVDLWSTLSSS